jgi:hypothetical protein
LASRGVFACGGAASLCVQSQKVNATGMCSFPHKAAGKVAPSRIYETAQSSCTAEQITAVRANKKKARTAAEGKKQREASKKEKKEGGEEENRRRLKQNKYVAAD